MKENKIEKIERLELEAEEIENTINDLKKALSKSKISVKNIDSIIHTVNSLRIDWGDKRFQIFKTKYDIS